MIPSILMTVGRQYYTLAEYIDEAKEMGVSKRIAMTAIPEGLVPGMSKIFIAHPDAIVKVTADGKCLADLVRVVLGETYVSPDFAPYWEQEKIQPDEVIPDHMLSLTYAFSKLPAAERAKLTAEYGLVFHMGVIGYTFFEGVQFVMPAGETELPENARQLLPLVESGYVQPVHVTYVD